jgi:hypothetical protein
LPRYVSTAPDQSAIEVSGAVFLPKGAAPDGGWPVVAFARGDSTVMDITGRQACSLREWVSDHIADFR